MMTTMTMQGRYFLSFEEQLGKISSAPTLNLLARRVELTPPSEIWYQFILQLLKGLGPCCRSTVEPTWVWLKHREKKPQRYGEKHKLQECFTPFSVGEARLPRQRGVSRSRASVGNGLLFLGRCAFPSTRLASTSCFIPFLLGDGLTPRK